MTIARTLVAAASADYTDCTPIAADEIQNATNVLHSKRLCRYSCGGDELSEVTQLEIEFAKYCGVKYALAVNSCSSAIFLMLLASGMQPGARVLVPAFTFIAVPSAIVNAGGVPVLVECGSDYCVDLDDLRRKLPSAHFFLLSHMRGNVANLDAIVQMCEDEDVVLLEDCAHAVGVLWNGVQTGRFGRAAAFSMQAHKVLNSGEGGFLISDDAQLMLNAAVRSGAYEKNWAKHSLPPNVKPDFAVPLHNFRMSNLTASVLRPQIAKIAARRDDYNRKYNLLTDILAASRHLYLPPRPPELTYLGDSIQFTLKDLSEAQITEFMQKMKATGLALSLIGRDNNNARCFWNWKFIHDLPASAELPLTQRMLMYTCDLRLPLYLDDAQVRQIGKTILSTLTNIATQG